MTQNNYLSLTTFVPGTKAKADEVNANFIDIIDKLEDVNARIDDADGDIVNINSLLSTANSQITTINTTLSNKANSSDVDGKWTIKHLKLFESLNLSNSNNTQATYSLNSYLPDKTNLYQILVRGTVATGTAMNNFVPLYITTDWSGSSHFSICSARTRVANLKLQRAQAESQQVGLQVI